MLGVMLHRFRQCRLLQPVQGSGRLKGETLTLQVATGIIRSRATTPTDNPALLDSIKGSKFRGEPPSSSSVNTRAGRRPSTYAAVEPSTTNRPNRDGLVEA
ncbi:hypothetical protein pipiens_016544 [Culex pipiens pipiens]|uniref:Uncharacterized protein n=1 Tax=Culex pipiens pipiens TaxID=38569 RepID=A0ABD1CKU0_CULPP